MTLKCITSPKDFDTNGKFHKDGLFSEQIFGPINDYVCQCDIVKIDGGVCSVCGVEYTTSSERSSRVAKIQLKFPVLKPNIIMESFTKIKQLIDKSSSEKNITETIKEIFQDDELYTDSIIVIPPSVRPIRTDLGVTDSINEVYKSIIIHNQELMKISEYENDVMAKIYSSYITLVEMLKSKLSGKEGFIRERLLGRRTKFSARTVISPDPYLSGKIRIPYKIAVHIFEPYLYHLSCQPIHKYLTLVKHGNYSFSQFSEIKKELQKISNKFYIVINRSPSLHNPSIQAYEFDYTYGNSIQIPPNICPPFNADFDGDSVIGNIALYDDNSSVIFSGNIKDLLNYCTK